jgi:ubiquinone/menaquinone biosynthesis C-methylase UbiE
MQRSTRVNYDAIAERYDTTPHREKSAGPELIAFLVGRGPTATLTLLDIACGSGNQQVANRGLTPNAKFDGLDGSLGMLRQARRKMPDIACVHGDSTALPFASGSFDFVSCQYAFHHFRDKVGMLRETFRVLRRGGRFALYNMCPQESNDWLYYAYFPEAKTRDFTDFWPPDEIVSEMTQPVLPESRWRGGMSTASATWRSCCRPCGSANGIRNCYRYPTRRMRPGCGASSATLTIRRRPRCAPSICALSRCAAIGGRSRKFGLRMTASGADLPLPARSTNAEDCPIPVVRSTRRVQLSRVESRCGAVVLGRPCRLPPLSSGGALVGRP